METGCIFIVPSMKFSANIEFRTFLKLTYTLAYRKVLNVLLVAIGVLLLLLALVYAFTYFFTEYSHPGMPTDIMTLLAVGISSLLLTPLSEFWRIKRMFSSNSLIRDRIFYHISHESVNISGESFDSVLKWSSLWKVLETRQWFLLYQSRDIFTPIPKDAMTNEQVDEIRTIIQRADVKKKLQPLKSR